LDANGARKNEIHVEHSREFFHAPLMSKRDPRVDDYIAKSADFAKPVLKRIRKLVHAACPSVTETLKWSSPFYEHKGILLCTPAFKQHCRLVFWKGRLFLGGEGKQFGRITALADLPSDKILLDYIKKAVELNEAGTKAPVRAKPKAKRALVVPAEFLIALKRSKRAQAGFENCSPSCKREYVEWITEAKRAETRATRIKTAIEWLAEGKSRYWRYQS